MVCWQTWAVLAPLSRIMQSRRHHDDDIKLVYTYGILNKSVFEEGIVLILDLEDSNPTILIPRLSRGEVSNDTGEIQIAHERFQVA